MLSIRGLQVPPLRAFSAEVCAGEWVGLRGDSGSGKSRLLYALADLLPHRGDVRLDGLSCASHSPQLWRRQVMMIPSASQWWFPTACEHFAEQPGEDVLARLKLNASLLHAPVETLSTGQQQRLALLRALSYRPRVLLCDEITANLDSASTLAVEGYLSQWVQRLSGRAIIWCTHDTSQLERVCQRCWVIEKGEVKEAA